MRIHPSFIALGALFLAAVSGDALAGDAKALAQGFKDEEACNKPYAETLDAKAFIGCLNGLDPAEVCADACAVMLMLRWSA